MEDKKEFYLEMSVPTNIHTPLLTFFFIILINCTAAHISARNLAVDNHTVYTPTLYYHYTPHYT